jgi:ElaA protein
MKIAVKTFNELTIDELYAVLRLRAEVFVVEQDCGAYFDKPSIGRVVVAETARGKAFGHAILRASIETIETRFGKQPIEISAQTYLEKFYNDHNFNAVGATYLEDGIPHVRMIRD